MPSHHHLQKARGKKRAKPKYQNQNKKKGWLSDKSQEIYSIDYRVLIVDAS